MKVIILLFLFSGLLARDTWDVNKANEWYNKQPYLVGSNFIPSTAINQLEMWQESSFDLETIDRELGFAEKIGFNFMRVFLHNLLWQENRESFKERVNKFLELTSKHNIKVLLVLFDDCWNGSPKLGKQPDPIQGVHNSGWVQAPGDNEITDRSLYPIFEQYVKDMLTSFDNDDRVLMWDLYNEPGNSGHGDRTFDLLENVFKWAKETDIKKPVTAGWWAGDFNSKLNVLQFENSDIITFHNYSTVENSKNLIGSLRRFNKPLICTEYMARTIGSRFVTHLPLFKSENIGAINWGLVSGKTNTIFPWGSKEGSPEPETWFHDVFRKDGTSFQKEETDFITNLLK